MRIKNTLIAGLALLLLLPTLSMAATKKIGIIVFDGVLTSDVTAPLEVFGAASKLSWFNDYEVVSINADNKTNITTEEGLTLVTDTWVGNAPEVDVLIAPSSYSMSPLLKNKQLISYISEQGGKADWVAGNCSGNQLLAQAGLLDGKQATTWAGGEQEFQKMFPKVKVIENQNVVVDGKFISSNGSVVSYQAALTLLKNISSEKKANEVAEAIQFQRLSNQPY